MSAYDPIADVAHWRRSYYPCSMFTAGRSALLLGLIFVVASCERPVEPSGSLVGAKKLPSSPALVEEVIEISRTRSEGAKQVRFHMLSYELRPDNTLAVTHILRGYPDDETIGRETFQLSAEAAREARLKLSRIRPAKLELLSDLRHPARPTGCIRRSAHDQGEVSVMFLLEGDSAQVDDDRLAVFELPHPSSCDNEKAVSARKLVDDVLRSYPLSSVAADFAD